MVLWRTVLTLTGGLRVHGAAGLPPGPCVIVANHSSHADTAALIAALPARRQPAVAAAADYWFRGGVRPAICRALCAAFPVRRSGGGSADLAAAVRLLAAGHDVIVFPEGTRSRDGQTGDFHRGAARLAAAAGAPLVPAGISGTRTLLPPGGPPARVAARSPSASAPRLSVVSRRQIRDHGQKPALFARNWPRSCRALEWVRRPVRPGRGWWRWWPEVVALVAGGGAASGPSSSRVPVETGARRA